MHYPNKTLHSLHHWGTIEASQAAPESDRVRFLSCLALLVRRRGHPFPWSHTRQEVLANHRGVADMPRLPGSQRFVSRQIIGMRAKVQSVNIAQRVRD